MPGAFAFEISRVLINSLRMTAVVPHESSALIPAASPDFGDCFRQRTLAQVVRIGLLFCLIVSADRVWGQAPVNKLRPNNPASVTSRFPAPKRSAPTTTIVEFELLQATGGGGLHAQKWLQILEPLDVSLRVRRPVADDRPELKEREAGNTRYVTAIGTLDRGGNLIFPERTFSPSDSVKLKEWIEELRTYGIKGTPTGKPLWGMTEQQFDQLYQGLMKAVDFETEGRPLKDVVTQLAIPADFPLRWSSAANDLLRTRGDQTKIRQELKGFSTALTLAVILSENQLGFRPNRTPAGSIELVVEPRNGKTEQWPIGWPVQKPTYKALPKLYERVPIELSDLELADVLRAISELSEAPILIDHQELEARQIDLEAIKVSHPLKITSWSLALKQLVIPQRMTREFWQDEAGKVFVWITTTRAGRAKEES